MKRKIINIDETKCTGCGQCIPDCPEGALQLIEGKARLVSDLFCDGLGACIGTCPEGAISVVEREAVPYDERTVMKIIAEQGAPVIKAHLEHLAGHGQAQLYDQAIEYLTEKGIPIPDYTGPVQSRRGRAVEHGEMKASRSPASDSGIRHPTTHVAHQSAGCPGAAARSIPRAEGPHRPVNTMISSELRQWPVQLRLLNPSAPYFENADLLISADCVPFAYARFHEEILKGKIAVIFCPKLDTDIEGYIEKLSQIFSLHPIGSITVVHMEVPCCSGVQNIVERALERSGKNIPVTEKMITIEGDVK